MRLRLIYSVSEWPKDTYQLILQGDTVDIHSRRKVFCIALSLRRWLDLQTLVLLRV